MKKQLHYATIIKIAISILVIMFFVFSFICFYSFRITKNLTDEYVGETASLYIQQLNTSIYHIGLDMAYQMTALKKETAVLPEDIHPKEGVYYSTLNSVLEKNRFFKLRYKELESVYYYIARSDLMIGTTGSSFRQSFNTKESLMIKEHLRSLNGDSQLSQISWYLLGGEEKPLLLGCYHKDQTILACTIDPLSILESLRRLPSNYYTGLIFEFKNDSTCLYSGFSEEEWIACKNKSPDYVYNIGSIGSVKMYILGHASILDKIYHYHILLVVLITVMLLGICFTILILYRRLMKPLAIFVSHLEDVEKEQYLNDTGTNRILELETANEKFRLLLRKLQQMRISIYEKELEEKYVELDFYQEQLRPHFFLNCLSVIHSIADMKRDREITDITVTLSDYSRYLFGTNSTLMPVRDEISHVDSYVCIQHIRYGESAFSFYKDIDESLLDLEIPKLIIHTLVENSITHSVGEDQQPEVSLFITKEVINQEDFLYICVSDTGSGFKENIITAIMNDEPIIYDGRKHIGLQNVKKRLELTYAGKAEFIISNMDENYGAIAEVRIPMNMLTVSEHK